MFAFRSQNTQIWGVVWLNLINIEYMIRFYMKGMLCLDLGLSVNFFSQGTSYEMSGIDGSPFLIFCVKRQASPHLDVLRVWTKRIHISFSGGAFQHGSENGVVFSVTNGILRDING